MKTLALLACSFLVSHLQDGRQPILPEPVVTTGRSPEALERLLQRYDAMYPGSDRDAVELEVDAMAAQRYATVSRLFWYTDLEDAKAAARASGRPILSLRMLGRLDEDLSCANSRLFRVVLYGNGEVSQFLRENYVLHWSSERAAPRITIDFGDGRRIETTVGGNSAHYVLDAEGRPLDVLPGLFSPVAFRRELEAVLPLARDSASLPDDVRLDRVREHHRQRRAASQALWNHTERVDAAPLAVAPKILAAERLTATKSMAEMPSVLGAVLGGAWIDPTTGRANELATLTVGRLFEARLDDASRALVRRLAPVDWEVDPRPLAGDAVLELIRGLEALVAADTRANDTGPRAWIHQWFETGAALPGLDELNERLYREIFLTPADDPWLGLSTPGIFTGLPGDGVMK